MSQTQQQAQEQKQTEEQVLSGARKRKAAVVQKIDQQNVQHANEAHVDNAGQATSFNLSHPATEAPSTADWPWSAPGSDCGHPAQHGPVGTTSGSLTQNGNTEVNTSCGSESMDKAAPENYSTPVKQRKRSDMPANGEAETVHIFPHDADITTKERRAGARKSMNTNDEDLTVSVLKEQTNTAQSNASQRPKQPKQRATSSQQRGTSGQQRASSGHHMLHNHQQMLTQQQMIRQQMFNQQYMYGQQQMMFNQQMLYPQHPMPYMGYDAMWMMAVSRMAGTPSFAGGMVPGMTPLPAGMPGTTSFPGGMPVTQQPGRREDPMPLVKKEKDPQPGPTLSAQEAHSGSKKWDLGKRRSEAEALQRTGAQRPPEVAHAMREESWYHDPRIQKFTDTPKNGLLSAMETCVAKKAPKGSVVDLSNNASAAAKCSGMERAGLNSKQSTAAIIESIEQRAAIRRREALGELGGDGRSAAGGRSSTPTRSFRSATDTTVSGRDWSGSNNEPGAQITLEPRSETQQPSLDAHASSDSRCISSNQSFDSGSKQPEFLPCAFSHTRSKSDSRSELQNRQTGQQSTQNTVPGQSTHSGGPARSTQSLGGLSWSTALNRSSGPGQPTQSSGLGNYAQYDRSGQPIYSNMPAQSSHSYGPRPPAHEAQNLRQLQPATTYMTPSTPGTPGSAMNAVSGNGTAAAMQTQANSALASSSNVQPAARQPNLSQPCTAQPNPHQPNPRQPDPHQLNPSQPAPELRPRIPQQSATPRVPALTAPVARYPYNYSRQQGSGMVIKQYYPWNKGYAGVIPLNIPVVASATSAFTPVTPVPAPRGAGTSEAGVKAELDSSSTGNTPQSQRDSVSSAPATGSQSGEQQSTPANSGSKPATIEQQAKTTSSNSQEEPVRLQVEPAASGSQPPPVGQQAQPTASNSQQAPMRQQAKSTNGGFQQEFFRQQSQPPTSCSQALDNVGKDSRASVPVSGDDQRGRRDNQTGQTDCQVGQRDGQAGQTYCQSGHRDGQVDQRFDQLGQNDRKFVSSQDGQPPHSQTAYAMPLDLPALRQALYDARDMPSSSIGQMTSSTAQPMTSSAAQWVMSSTANLLTPSTSEWMTSSTNHIVQQGHSTSQPNRENQRQTDTSVTSGNGHGSSIPTVQRDQNDYGTHTNRNPAYYRPSQGARDVTPQGGASACSRDGQANSTRSTGNIWEDYYNAVSRDLTEGDVDIGPGQRRESETGEIIDDNNDDEDEDDDDASADANDVVEDSDDRDSAIGEGPSSADSGAGENAEDGFI